MMNSLKKQKGAAIIVALFVVALVAALATLMIDRFRIDMRRSELIFNSDKTYFVAEGAVAWAIDSLNQNWIHQQPNKIIDKMPLYLPPMKVNNMTVESTVYDAQGLFNINNVTDTNFQSYFTRLLQLLLPTLEPEKIQTIVTNVKHWITAEQNPALDEYYYKLNPSYKVPHKPMANISELRLVKGITAGIYAKISPFLVALPTTTMISINNTQAPILMSLSLTLTPGAANEVINNLQKTPILNAEQFSKNEILKNNGIDVSKVAFSSNFFLVRTNVTLGDKHFLFYTMIERQGQERQSKTNILWQTKGAL